MLLSTASWSAILWASLAESYIRIPRQTLSASPNATSTDDESIAATPTMPDCCSLSADSVPVIVWYSSSIDVVVATVSTIVYQYNNTAITSYDTFLVSNTLPTDIFGGWPTISGVPTDIITGGDFYDASTTLIYGTAFTDPYGDIYASPTPVLIFTDVIYASMAPLQGDGYYYYCAAAGEAHSTILEDVKVYPSGFYLPDFLPYDQGPLDMVMPSQVQSWMESNVPPNAPSWYYDLSSCSVGISGGMPTAHIPVNQLTASVETTSFVGGYYGNIPRTTSSTPTLPPPTTTSIAPYTPPTSETISTSKSSANAGPTGSVTVSGAGPANSGGSGSTSVALGPGNLNPNGGSNAAPSNLGGGMNLETSNSNPNSPTPTTAVVFIAGGTTYTANSALNFIIGSSTLTPGGIVILSMPGSSSPTTYILPSNPTAIIINGATQALQNIALPATPAATHLLVLGSSTYTENSASGFHIGSQTLTSGGIIIVAGETISLSPNGATAILISGISTSTQTLQTLTPATSPHIIVIGSSTYTENLASQYVVGDQTLTEGGVITASGEIVSLETGGASVVVASGESTLTQALGSVAPSPTDATKSTSTKSAGAKMVPCLMSIWVMGFSILAGLV